MTIEINTPDIGASEVEVTEILVDVGDKVDAEQSLITVEGDKASMEIPSPQAGVVKELKVSVGDKITTGKLIMVFEESMNGANKLATTMDHNDHVVTIKPVAPDIIAHNKEIYVPDIGNSEVEVTEIMVKVGDKISLDQSLIAVEDDKSSMEIPAPFAGTVKEIKINVGDKISTGSHIMILAVEDDNVTAIPIKEVDTKKRTATALLPTKDKEGELAERGNCVHATPLIRRLASEFGVDLTKVKGTGRKGRILSEDIRRYIKDVIKRAEVTSVVVGGASFPNLAQWPKVDFSKFGNIEEMELSRIQKISGANLHRNWIQIPHVTQFDEVDITELEAFRKQQNTEAEKKKLDVKITPLVFIMKAVAKGLEELPRFNSSLFEDPQKITLKKYINIGVAVDTPNGLVVPVFRDVNKKGIVELSRELAEILKKVRAGKLVSSDMQGGCFTISSLGNIGGTAFTPIINAPEVAILGVSKSSMKPVWNGEKFLPRLMLPLSLSYDHRVIDGADGARFMGLINNVLSDIRRLVI